MKYFNLEFRKINRRPYIVASFVISIFGLLIGLLMSAIQYIDPKEIINDPNLVSYNFLYGIMIIINIIGFSCLAATMHGRFTMSSYENGNIYLTIPYPVSRKKILFFKITTVNIFCSIGFLLSVAFNFTLFTLINILFNIIKTPWNVNIIMGNIPLVLLGISFVISVGIISLYIGWLKNSFPIVIVSSLVIGSMISNGFTFGGGTPLYILGIIIFIIGIFLNILMYGKVERLEVE